MIAALVALLSYLAAAPRSPNRFLPGRFNCVRFPRVTGGMVFLLSTACLAQVPTVQVHCDFASGAGWHGVNNRPPLNAGVNKVQGFGYSATTHASQTPGEIGGRISRSLTPAAYFKTVPVKTLEDALSASGRLSVTECSGGSGLLFGWFNHASRGWRTPNSLVFRIDGDSGKFRVFFEYGTQQWRTGGGETFEGRWQETKTPLHAADGTPHTWALVYDPSGSGGQGNITFTFDGTPYEAVLGEGHKADGAAFDRFGLMNQQSAGDELTAYIGDIVINGESQQLSRDPGWESIGSRCTFRDTALRPYHNFDWRDSAYAGGSPGEIGGLIWRIESIHPEQAFSYGMPIGRLSFKEALTASGKITMRGAAADSALFIGWYNTHTAIGAPPANFMGLLIEGPSSVGHYLRPACANSAGAVQILEAGPILHPDKASHTWRVSYTPVRDGGNGNLVATLDEKSVSLQLLPEFLRLDASFDGFGVLSLHRGGLFIEAYLDDLEFTAQDIFRP